MTRFDPSRLARCLWAVVLVLWCLCLPLMASADDEGEQPGPSRREGLQPIAKGDLADMRQRRTIRILASPDDVFYRIQRQDDQGMIPNLGKQLEQQLNSQRQPGQPAIKVVMVPTPAEDLIPRLREGRGDIAMPALSIPPPDGTLASVPVLAGGDPVVITDDKTGAIHTEADLVGKKILITAHHPARALLAAQKQPALNWAEAPEGITENGLLDLVRIGAVDAVIVERFLGEFWTGWHKNLRQHSLPLGTGDQHMHDLVWYVRTESSDLLTEINRLLGKNNTKTAKWLADIKKKPRLTSVTSPQELARFRELWPHFRDLAPKYGLDPHIVAGVAYQESRLRQSARGSGGATGIMQLMPATGQHPSIGGMRIDGSARDNIEAGLRYLRMLSQRFLNDPDIDAHNRTLMVLLAYHRGPATLERARDHARSLGLDANIWFRHVDQAAARLMGQEPLDYVQNVAKYAWIFSQHTDTAPAPATAQMVADAPMPDGRPPIPTRKPDPASIKKALWADEP